jgi:2-succinyl-5-enolpyruvyl-6-hydroxy-3-cyclohexene-1-carboxylate synthase
MNDTLIQTLLLHLARLGVREVCIAAGARNAPLVSALAASQGLRLWHFFEERSAAFFALGRMMIDARPVAVLTTSGTAAAELLPAVIEAHYQAQPLILITADRPARFRGTGAPQAIEQVGLYGPYAERTLDVSPLSEDVSWPSKLGTKPMHFNVCLDEPLTPCTQGIDFSAWDRALESVATSGSRAMAELLESFIAERSRLVVLAAGLHPAEARAIAPALRRLGVPIVAATANLHGLGLEPLLAKGGERALKELDPKRVLRLGSVPSWRWWRDLEQRDGVHLMHLARASFSGLARHQGTAVQPLALLNRIQIDAPTGRVEPMRCDALDAASERCHRR